MSLQENVDRGAKLLDRVYAGWHEKVNLDRLAMQDCTRCIIGQVYGTYFAALYDLRQSGQLVGDESAHGFMLADEPETYGERSAIWRELGDLWRAEVRARLAADAGGTPP